VRREARVGAWTARGERVDRVSAPSLGGECGVCGSGEAGIEENGLGLDIALGLGMRRHAEEGAAYGVMKCGTGFSDITGVYDVANFGKRD
jgi:hypothetical protein